MHFPTVVTTCFPRAYQRSVVRFPPWLGRRSTPGMMEFLRGSALHED